MYGGVPEAVMVLNRAYLSYNNEMNFSRFIEGWVLFLTRLFFLGSCVTNASFDAGG